GGGAHSALAVFGTHIKLVKQSVAAPELDRKAETEHVVSGERVVSCNREKAARSRIGEQCREKLYPLLGVEADTFKDAELLHDRQQRRDICLERSAELRLHSEHLSTSRVGVARNTHSPDQAFNTCC